MSCTRLLIMGILFLALAIGGESVGFRVPKGN